MRAAKIIIVILGIFSLMCAGLGLLYNFATLTTALAGVFDEIRAELDAELPGFETIFYAMWGICTIFYVALFSCGIQFLRFRIGVVWPFTAVMGLEMMYFFTISRLWIGSPYAESIAAATGIANGGLMAQFLLLFPIWGPILAFVARAQIRRHHERDLQAQDRKWV